MARPPPRRRVASKGGGFWGGLFLLILGFTGGAGAAAVFAAYINELPLPLSPPPTRDANRPAEDSLQRTRRETLEFHETLRQRHAAPVSAEDDSAPSAPAAESRRFVYYLQFGAFARRDAAEGLRGELALSGAQAEIRAGGGEGGEVFRVWAGPYPSSAAAEESRAELALQGYDKIQLLKLAERNDDGEGDGTE
ncbi:MAG: SPOR domain-containing protein [Gammaproteobacteria bacterium]